MSAESIEDYIAEIERLRKENAKLNEHNARLIVECKKLREDVDRLVDEEEGREHY